MDSYKQSIQAIGVSVERLTAHVPADGWFYVLQQGQVQGRYRTLKAAQIHYRELVNASGWSPPPVEKRRADPSVEAVERYMDELTEYWGSSHGHRKPGVKRA